MAEELMISCDNPDCTSVGKPEYVPWIEQNRRRRKSDRITGPYGWHEGEGGCIGTGPNYHYTACSDDCVGPAIAEKVRQGIEEIYGER